MEVFLDAPLEACERRDPKGLYRKARAGEIPSFTGVSAPYERPSRPDLVLRTHEEDAPSSVSRVLGLLRARGLAPAEPA